MIRLKTTYHLLPTTHKHAFTLVEMLIIAPIVILVIGIFISAIVSMTGEVLSVRGANALTYNVQNALDTIDADVKSSSGYLATNNVTLTTGQGYNNDATDFHNANTDTSIGTMLILNSYATTANPLSSARSYIYVPNQPNACTSASVSQNSKVMMNIVYFVKDDNSDGVKSLFRRVLMQPDFKTAGCSPPWQKPTCTIGYSASFCEANDIKLVDGISTSGFVINYYAAGSTTANAIANASAQTEPARQAAMQTTNTVGVTINAAKTYAGRDIAQSGTIKSVSENNNITGNIVTNGIVLNLDAGNIASYPGSGSIWYDLNANGKFGTLINGPTYSATNGGALVFNGSNYVQNSSGGFLPNGSSARTIMFWYKPNAGMTDSNSAFGYGCVGFEGAGCNSVSTGKYIGAYASTSSIGIHTETCGVYGPVTPSPSTNWHLFTAVFNGNNTITYYTDGSNASTLTSGCLIDTNIGASGYSVGVGRWGYYNGSISAVNVYNRALSASEVLQNFNALRGRYGL